MLKSELRKEIRQRKRQFTEAQLRELSLAVGERLMRHPRLLASKVIMMYCSLPDEVDTRDLLRRLLEMRKTVVLPAVVDDTRMTLRRYTGPQDLCEGAFHIMEPIGNEFDDYASIDLAVVPGMSFDAAGNRLGRGKGYYDRFFQHIPQTYKIGICFDFQKVEHVPVGPLDVPVNQVL